MDAQAAVCATCRRTSSSMVLPVPIPTKHLIKIAYKTTAILQKIRSLLNTLHLLIVRPSRRQRRSLADLSELQRILTVDSTGIDSFPGWIRVLRVANAQHRIGIVLVSRFSSFPFQQKEVNHFFRVMT